MLLFNGCTSYQNAYVGEFHPYQKHTVEVVKIVGKTPVNQKKQGASGEFVATLAGAVAGGALGGEVGGGTGREAAKWIGAILGGKIAHDMYKDLGGGEVPMYAFVVQDSKGSTTVVTYPVEQAKFFSIGQYVYLVKQGGNVYLMQY